MEIWNSLPDFVRSTIWIVVVMVCLILSVAFTTLWERKVIGWMQLRKGPNRVGSLFGFLPGILQPFADVIKLLVKEDHRLPFVEFRAVFQGGVLAEDKANHGIAQLLARAIDRIHRSESVSKLFESER